MRRASGWENIPSIAATTTCFSVRETQRDKFRVLPSLRSFAQVRIVPQSMASATGSSTLRQVSIFTYSLHFFDFAPSSRSISSTPRRVERPQTQVLPSQPFRRVKRTTPSAPHCLTFFVLSPTSNDRLPRPPYVATSPTSLASTGVLPEAKVAHFRDMLWLVSSCFEACTLNASRDALRARTRCWPSWHSSAPSASSATC